MPKFLFEFAFEDVSIDEKIPSKEIEFSGNENGFITLKLDLEEGLWESMGMRDVELVRVTALEDFKEKGVKKGDIVFNDFYRDFEQFEKTKDVGLAKTLLEKFKPIWGTHSIGEKWSFQDFKCRLQDLSG